MLTWLATVVTDQTPVPLWAWIVAWILIVGAFAGAIRFVVWAITWKPRPLTAPYYQSPEYEREFARNRLIVLARDNRRCRICGVGGRVDVHHVIPRAKGGSNDPSNMVTLCVPHHQAQHRHRW